AKADVALVVFLLVIPAERVSQPFRSILVEPDGGEQAAGGLYAGHRRALALVGDNRHRVACLPQKTLVGGVMHAVVRCAIMREPYLAPVRRIASRPKPVDM